MNTESPTPDDSMISLRRRDFVRKSALASGEVTFAGLIKAAHGGPSATTTSGGTTTTAGVLTVVSRTQTYYGTYTFPGLAGNSLQTILQLKWDVFYGGSGAEHPETYEPGPESNYVSVSLLESIEVQGSNQPTVTDQPDGSVVVDFDGVTLLIKKRIKAIPE